MNELERKRIKHKKVFDRIEDKNARVIESYYRYYINDGSDEWFITTTPPLSTMKANRLELTFRIDAYFGTTKSPEPISNIADGDNEKKLRSVFLVR